MKISSGQKKRMQAFIKWMRNANRGIRSLLFKMGLFTVGLKFQLEYLLLREGIDLDSFVDLGCGPHSVTAILPDEAYSVGVDIFDEYLEESKINKIHQEYIKEDLCSLKLDDNAFDATIMLDVIEHLKKEDGLDLIKRAEKWSKKKIIIYAPRAFKEQHTYHENPYQEHRSAWSVQDFRKLGFKMHGVKGLKSINQLAEKFEKGPLRFFIIVVGSISQIYAYFFPNHAIRMFCVKEL